MCLSCDDVSENKTLSLAPFCNDLTSLESLLKEPEKDAAMALVKTMLRNYVQKNANEKDRHLLECHAHCFITLS